MKTLDFNQMAMLNAGYRVSGWQWTVEEHIGCALAGVVAGCGVLGVAAYASCLLLCAE
jgi:hypothetical protein